MRDDSQQRAELVKHLESAIALSSELGLPTTGYLAERALDDARAQFWGLPEGKPAPSKGR